MGLRSLQHIRIRRSTGRGLSPARFVPPSGFGYPLDGLLPSYPAPVLFRTGSAPGINPSELSPRGRYPACFRTGRTHIPFRSPVYLRTRRCEGRLDEPRFLGFDPTDESLATERVFSTPTAGCSLGLVPSKVSRGSLDRDSARSPLTRFAGRTYARPSASQSFDQLPLRLLRPTGKPAGVG
jgi:hypothetical protein